MGPGFSPKLILDFLDEMSYLMMLSGTLEGLDNLVYFHRYGRTSWLGRSYYFYSKCSLPAIILHKKFVEGGLVVPHGLAIPQKTFQTRLMNSKLVTSKYFIYFIFWDKEIEMKENKNNYSKEKEKQLKQKEGKLAGTYLDGDLFPPR
jgi:hypothetical protein